MPLYVYFAAALPASWNPKIEGICGTPVNSVETEDLSLFYSDVDALSTDPNALAEIGLQFFRVQEAAFSSTSIVPFRFPSTFADLSELQSFIAAQAEALHLSLVKVAGKSQFDIRISSSSQPGSDVSGTEYLRARASRANTLASLESVCRQQLSDIACEWLSSHEQQRTTLHVLVPRHTEPQVAQRFRNMPAPADGRIVVLGPWPPGAFVNTAVAVRQ